MTKAPAPRRRLKNYDDSIVRDLREQAAKKNKDPLQIMYLAMVELIDAGNAVEAAKIAKELAPYLHPRMATVTLEGGERPIELSLAEQIRRGATIEGTARVVRVHNDEA